jgi:hypothetical protein
VASGVRESPGQGPLNARCDSFEGPCDQGGPRDVIGCCYGRPWVLLGARGVWLGGWVGGLGVCGGWGGGGVARGAENDALW